MKTFLVTILSLFFAASGNAQNMQKAALIDMGGKSIVLYGFVDYKVASDYLNAKMTGVVKLTPYNDKKAPALTEKGEPDYVSGVYAMISLVRADNRDAETGYINDAKYDSELAMKNPRGILKPQIFTQGNVTFYITNPVLLNSVYKDSGLKFNPDATGMILDHFYTTSQRFADLSMTLWSNKTQIGSTEPVAIAGIDKTPASLSGRGFFKDAEGKIVMDLKMGESTTIATTYLDRNWKANIIAGNDAETMVYPVNAVDQVFQRFYDVSVDSFEVGGPIKTLLDNMKFQPFLWQATTHRASEIFFNYAP